MSTAMPPAPRPANPHKRHKGLVRLWHAVGHSLHGLRAAWQEEAAFRQEAVLTGVLIPLACWLGATWVETVVLCATMALVLVAELLNSAVEAAIDRVGLEWHPLSKRAKDLASAAVLVALVLNMAAWAAAACHWLGRP